ncbi:MAG: 30S ribosomal protein S14 [Candidatus Lokiarchaeota archaeon]|nr:30S ribosomal protein S14 [Candidatus Lokiarchaeota archaeon]
MIIMPQGKMGKGKRECRRCHTHRGLIRRYGLYICRRCFYEIGKEIGFHRFD